MQRRAELANFEDFGKVQSGDAGDRVGFYDELNPWSLYNTQVFDYVHV